MCLAVLGERVPQAYPPNPWKKRGVRGDDRQSSIDKVTLKHFFIKKCDVNAHMVKEMLGHCQRKKTGVFILATDIRLRIAWPDTLNHTLCKKKKYTNVREVSHRCLPGGLSRTWGLGLGERFGVFLIKTSRKNAMHDVIIAQLRYTYYAVAGGRKTFAGRRTYIILARAYVDGDPQPADTFSWPAYWKNRSVNESTTLVLWGRVSG